MGGGGVGGVQTHFHVKPNSVEVVLRLSWGCDNKTVWLTQEKRLNIFQHQIEDFEQLIMPEDHSNEKSPVLNYDSFHNSGLYDPIFIKARNEYIFR